jgi:hypothetical protein
MVLLLENLEWVGLVFAAQHDRGKDGRSAIAELLIGRGEVPPNPPGFAIVEREGFGDRWISRFGWDR